MNTNKNNEYCGWFQHLFNMLFVVNSPRTATLQHAWILLACPNYKPCKVYNIIEDIPSWTFISILGALLKRKGVIHYICSGVCTAELKFQTASITPYSKTWSQLLRTSPIYVRIICMYIYIYHYVYIYIHIHSYIDNHWYIYSNEQFVLMEYWRHTCRIGLGFATGDCQSRGSVSP